MSSLQKRVLVSHLPPRPPMGLGPKPGGPRGRNRDYTPIHFSHYFTACKTVTIDKGELGQNKFCVYELGSGEGPAIFMLHGGGFSGLTWALTSQALTSMIQCRIFAMDIRGHGTTTTTDDSDLSAVTLAGDICDVIEDVVSGLGDPAPGVFESINCQSKLCFVVLSFPIWAMNGSTIKVLTKSPNKKVLTSRS